MDCFITRRGYVNSGGSSSKVTPEKLGYVSGANAFFDGRWNTPYGHVSDGASWTDLVHEKSAYRVSMGDTEAKDYIDVDYYIKPAVASGGIVLPIDMSTYSSFTVEAVVKIVSLDNYQSDIINTYASDNYGGFGITAETATKITLQAYSGGWKNMSSTYTKGEIVYVAMTFDGSSLKSYINGIYLSEASCTNRITNALFPCLGVKAGGKNEHAGGQSYYYRATIYDKVLTADEITQNYNRDVYRYVNGNADDIDDSDNNNEINGDDSVLIGGTVYTGTEYNEQSKSTSDLKDEIVEYCGFGCDGDFIPCNADGTLGFTITSSTIQQNYGESKTKADESNLVSTYNVILKNDKIFAFKHGEKEFHIITKDTNGNPVLFWCWNSQYIITNSSGSTGYMNYVARTNASYQHYIVPMCDFLAGNRIDGLYLVAASPSTSYTDYFVDFGGDIYRFFGQGGHQFAVKVST